MNTLVKRSAAGIVSLGLVLGACSSDDTDIDTGADSVEENVDGAVDEMQEGVDEGVDEMQEGVDEMEDEMESEDG